MNMKNDYKKIFKKYNGIMRTCELTKDGIFYQNLQELIKEGSVEKIMIFGENKALINLWKNYNPGPELEKSEIHDVLVQIEQFIGPVFQAIVKEDEFLEILFSNIFVW